MLITGTRISIYYQIRATPFGDWLKLARDGVPRVVLKSREGRMMSIAYIIH